MTVRSRGRLVACYVAPFAVSFMPAHGFGRGRGWRLGLLAVCAAALLGLSMIAPAVQAQEDGVIATVNGEPVRYSDLALAESDFASELAGIPEETRLQYLVGILIDRKLLAQAAREKGLADDPEVARRVAFETERVLGDVYLARSFADAVTSEEARAEYDRRVADVELKEEVRARHILLDSEAAAQEALARIEAGEDFAAVAREVSKGPSGEKGGDLGWFTREHMVSGFSDAAFALAPGEVSGPVKTDFGWHVIKVEDRRMQQLIPFEEVEADIKAEMRNEKAITAVKAMREAADIAYPGADRPQLLPPQ